MERLDYQLADAKNEIISLLSDLGDEAEDNQLLIDMLEGETELFELSEKLVEMVFSSDANADMNKQLAAKYTERANYCTSKGKQIRSFIKQLMDVAGQKKLPLSIATISIRKGNESVEVTDINSLPQGYYKLERKADSAAIKASLKAGEDIPGAILKIGADSISIRTK